MPEITARLSTALADRYKIESHLGEGGMANVYLAEDLKHHRKVAVKVLRPELAAVLGAERFVKEIETTANLQHPHILPLFDSGEADSFLYYVMPFIDGETLRDKLNRETQLGIDEAVKITTEVADALDYAHRQNVIHRDIKPENILLHDGRPMVADFGIALAVSAAAGGRMTETGLSLGTPHYMSPEQATAEKDLTNRSDIYSLGCVLYEMLTGDPPHTGSSAQQIIMKIVAEDVQPVTELRKSVPPNVAAAVGKSLEKLAADRFGSAAMFGEALTNPAFTLPTTQAATVAGAPISGMWKRLSISLASLAAVLAVVALWGWLRPSAETPLAVVRYGMPIDLLTTDQGQFGTSVALSPDGSRLVYVGAAVEGIGSQLWIRNRDQLDINPIPGTEQAHQPFFSPDGEQVAFISTTERWIKVASLGGAPPLQVMDEGVFRLGGAWGADGYLYFSQRPDGGLSRVPSGGGAPEQLSAPDTSKNETRHAWPSVLPNGRGVLITVQRGNNAVTEEDDVGVLDLETGEVDVLVRGLLGRYAPTGHLIFVRFDGAVMAIPFDQDKLETTGSAVPLLGDVAAGVRGPDFALSHSGRLVYVTEGVGLVQQRTLVLVDRQGNESPLTTMSRAFVSPRFSPSGDRVAVTVLGPDYHIWVYDVDQGTLSPRTFEGSYSAYATWTPDGTRLTFATARGGPRELYSVAADGGSRAEPFFASQHDIRAAVFSPDGKWLAFIETGTTTRQDILVMPLDGEDRTPRPFAQTSFDESQMALSPDGRWLAYVSDESGQDEVYVRAFPEPAGQTLVSVNGAIEPMWSLDGRMLFYRAALLEMVAASVQTEPVFRVTARDVLFVDTYDRFSNNYADYDIDPRSGRFLMIKSDEATGEAEIIVVENWFEELKAKVGN